MAFNAKWILEDLSLKIKIPLTNLINEFENDIVIMVNNCKVFRLSLNENGDCFQITDKNNRNYSPPEVLGFYSIFSPSNVIYYGKANNLYRRLIIDPDNTANSNNIFQGQIRAIIKYVLYKKLNVLFEIDNLFIQLYPGNYEIGNEIFEYRYRLKTYSQVFESFLGIIINKYHKLIIKRAISDGFII